MSSEKLTTCEILLSRQEAEMGLLPSVCIACGERPTATKAVRLTAYEMGDRGLLARFWRRHSIIVLFPLCGEHQARRLSLDVKAIKITDRAVTLGNVAGRFVEELDRISDRMWREGLPVSTAHKPLPRRKRIGHRSNLRVLVILIALVAPLLVCTSLLMLRVMQLQWRPLRQRQAAPFDLRKIQRPNPLADAEEKNAVPRIKREPDRAH